MGRSTRVSSMEIIVARRRLIIDADLVQADSEESSQMIGCVCLFASDFSVYFSV